MLRNFGHRAMLDYELPEPRYGEDLYTLNRMIAGRGRITAGPRDTEDNRDRRCCGFGRECSWSAAGRGDQGHLLVDEFNRVDRGRHLASSPFAGGALMVCWIEGGADFFLFSCLPGGAGAVELPGRSRPAPGIVAIRRGARR